MTCLLSYIYTINMRILFKKQNFTSTALVCISWSRKFIVLGFFWKFSYFIISRIVFSLFVPGFRRMCLVFWFICDSLLCLVRFSLFFCCLHTLILSSLKKKISWTIFLNEKYPIVGLSKKNHVCTNLTIRITFSSPLKMMTAIQTYNGVN